MRLSIRSHEAPAVFFFLFFVIVCLYAGSLNNAFIYDENYLIVNNLHIRQLSLLPRIFLTDSFHFQHPADAGTGIYYRPLEILSYAVDYFFWGLKPFGYHLTNLFLHALNSFLAFLLISRLFKDKLLALLSAIFFAIHPVQACIVSIAAGRTNFLETSFMFLSLLAFINYSQRQKKTYYLLSLLFFVFAILSREGGLILPAFILLFAIFLEMDKKRIAVCLIPYVTICLFYLALRSRFIPCGRLDALEALSWRNIWFFIIHAQNYIGQLILPVEFQRILFGRSAAFQAALFCLSLLCIIYAAAKSIFSRDKLIAFAAAFYIAGLLPMLKSAHAFDSLGVMNISHYIYKSSLGFFVVIAYLMVRMPARARRFVTACLIIIVAGYSVLTVVLTRVYKDEWTYYHFSLKVDKSDVFIRVNLANLYFERKMYDKALAEARAILAKEPLAWDVWLLLGNIYNARGDTGKAVELFQKTLGIYPRSVEALNNLALIYKKQGKDKEAEGCFRKALAINPEYLLALKNYYNTLFYRGAYPEALKIGRRILRLEPDNPDVLLMQGTVLAQAGNLQEAKVILNKALNVRPDSLAVRNNLAALYGNMGELDKAVLMWQGILKIKPDDKEAKDNIERAGELMEGRHG